MKNKFDLSHEKKLTMNAGDLVPFMCQEVLPGDSFRLNSEVFVRGAPMIAPLMHMVDIRTSYFFVPNRIIWEDAEEFFTRGRDRDSSVTVPRILCNQANRDKWFKGKIGDYLGIPTLDDGAITVEGNHYFNALPFRACLEIYNEYYRNQEVIDEILYSKTSSDITVDEDVEALTVIRKRGWDKDYFTAAKLSATLTAEETSYAAVQPVEDGVTDLYKSQSEVYKNDGSDPSGNQAIFGTTGNALRLGSDTGELLRIENLNSPLGVNIEDIRKASALYRWMQKILNTGYKYVDYLKSIWQVNSSDARFQRPEYLGGSTQPLRISEVLNTSATATAPQGNPSGHAVSSGRSPIITRSFEEHGWLIGFVCVVPRASYAQGIPTFMKKFDHMDYANPMLANLGPQYLPSSHLYYAFNDTEVENEVNFGYVQRYAEYKSQVDSIHGDFRDSLNFWTYSRMFAARPALNEAFVQLQENTDIFAVEEGHHYMSQIMNNVSVLRKLPYYSNLEI